MISVNLAITRHSIWILLAGSILGFLGVALGAFGAHGFANLLSENQTVAIYQTASDYHFYHAIVLLIVAGLSMTPVGPQKTLALIGLAMTVGVIIFSGSLYALALSNIRWLGAITPIGGVLLLVGWGLLVFETISRFSQKKK